MNGADPELTTALFFKTLMILDFPTFGNPTTLTVIFSYPFLSKNFLAYLNKTVMSLS